MKRILIVEDDRFLASALEVKLVRENITVEVVGDGIMVMDRLEEYVPDLILLDLVIPEMDGFEVLERLRGREKYKQIPVVVLTNLNQPEDISKAKMLGVIDYIVKTDSSIGGVVEKLRSML